MGDVCLRDGMSPPSEQLLRLLSAAKTPSGRRGAVRCRIRGRFGQLGEKKARFELVYGHRKHTLNVAAEKPS